MADLASETQGKQVRKKYTIRDVSTYRQRAKNAQVGARIKGFLTRLKAAQKTISDFDQYLTDTFETVPTASMNSLKEALTVRRSIQSFNASTSPDGSSPSPSELNSEIHYSHSEDEPLDEHRGFDEYTVHLSNVPVSKPPPIKRKVPLDFDEEDVLQADQQPSTTVQENTSEASSTPSVITHQHSEKNATSDLFFQNRPSLLYKPVYIQGEGLVYPHPSHVSSGEPSLIGYL